MATSLISLRVVAILFGPGYRLYYGREGNTLVILLGGGTKARQARDIAAREDAG